MLYALLALFGASLVVLAWIVAWLKRRADADRQLLAQLIAVHNGLALQVANHAAVIDYNAQTANRNAQLWAQQTQNLAEIAAAHRRFLESQRQRPFPGDEWKQGYRPDGSEAGD